MGTPDVDGLLAEQQAYYRAMAPEYDEAARADPTEIDRTELESLLARFDPAGDVLELAGGDRPLDCFTCAVPGSTDGGGRI